MSAYTEQLKDPEWQKKRLKIMERDGWKCRDCGSGTKTLNVHHCYYAKGKKPWEADDIHLMTVCEECHEIRAAVEREWFASLAEFMATTPIELLQVYKPVLTLTEVLHEKLELEYAQMAPCTDLTEEELTAVLHAFAERVAHISPWCYRPHKEVGYWIGQSLWDAKVLEEEKDKKE